VGRDLATMRSALFVPAIRPERFGRAAESSADAIILDLEDAVAPSDKGAARGYARSWLEAGQRPLVRVNARETIWHEDDLGMVAQYGCPVMVPKVECAADIAAVRRILPDGAQIVALIESASAVINAAEICRAPGVVRAAFGSFDLGAEIGVDPGNNEALLFARSALVLASAAARIAPPLDGVTGDIHDADGLGEDVRRAHGLGFGGKLCIHPVQVERVNLGFTSSEGEIIWAAGVLNAANNNAGVLVLDGKMIDAPVIARARRIIALSD
jgi:citrate lyase subunit beta / citryl-CoA lyase